MDDDDDRLVNAYDECGEVNEDCDDKHVHSDAVVDIDEDISGQADDFNSDRAFEEADGDHDNDNDLVDVSNYNIGGDVAVGDYSGADDDLHVDKYDDIDVDDDDCNDNDYDSKYQHCKHAPNNDNFKVNDNDVEEHKDSDDDAVCCDGNND